MLSTMCPPLVLGPIVHYLNTLSTLNTSNQRVRNLLTGQNKTEIPETGMPDIFESKISYPGLSHE